MFLYSLLVWLQATIRSEEHTSELQSHYSISYAAGLKGNLLLIHGTGDDNVHYQNCEMLVNELVRHGKIFSQISYPCKGAKLMDGKVFKGCVGHQELAAWVEGLGL